LPDTTLVLFYLVGSVVFVLGAAFLPFSWIAWRGTRFLPERITNTRWFRGATRVSVMVFILVLGYGILFLGWNIRG
jgi:hypothetical protein